MNYNFNEIITFDYAEIKKALLFFVDAEDAFLSICEYVENKHSTLQEKFRVEHPNITTYIATYKYIKEENKIDTKNEIYIHPNQNIINAMFNDEYGTEMEVSEDTVPISDKIEAVEDYISLYFANRKSREYHVYWTYKIPEESYIYNYDNYQEIHIPPYRVVESTFYKKRYEDFIAIYSKNSLYGEFNVFTKKIGERFFNLRTTSTVICNSRTVIGDSISIDFGTISTANPCEYDTDNIRFDLDFVFNENTPVSDLFSLRTYAYRSLHNVTSFFLRSSSFDSRADNELIDTDNINSILSKLYEIDKDLIYDNLKVEVSRGSEAVSFKALFEIIITDLQEYYKNMLELFLSNYDDFGALSDMIKYLDDKIKDAKTNYARKDECNIPLDAVDTGCKIDCNQIHLERDHEMVTKQKLKSIVRCNLMCDTMPYTEEELTRYAAAPAVNTDAGNKFPKPNL